MLDPRAVLTAYDGQIRRSMEPPIGGWSVERAGPVIRAVAPPKSEHGGFVQYTELDDVTADEAIAAQLAFFAADGRRAEWKLYGHDQPADLAARLTAAGLVPEEREMLVVGETAEVLAALAARRPPSGIAVREADIEVDIDGIVALHEAVWGPSPGWTGRELPAEKATDPDGIDIYVAVDAATGEIVSAAWLRVVRDTDFAGLWGGSTLPAYRGRGIYTALVDVRVRLALERGYRYIQVDASPQSEPILRRLGLVALTWTQPFSWAPPS